MLLLLRSLEVRAIDAGWESLVLDPARLETEPLLESGEHAFLVVRFPAFTDGRGFSAPRILRSRLHVSCPIYASGPLLPDQAQHLWRSGFDGVVMEDQAPVETWRRCSGWHARFPQPGFV